MILDSGMILHIGFEIPDGFCSLFSRVGFSMLYDKEVVFLRKEITGSHHIKDPESSFSLKGYKRDMRSSCQDLIPFHKGFFISHHPFQDGFQFLPVIGDVLKLPFGAVAILKGKRTDNGKAVFHSGHSASVMVKAEICFLGEELLQLIHFFCPFSRRNLRGGISAYAMAFAFLERETEPKCSRISSRERALRVLWNSPLWKYHAAFLELQRNFRALSSSLWA